MNKTYGRINWENYPSDETPLNESNLNKIDVATDEIDNRVITLDTTKATKEEVSTLVQDVAFEEKTGIITIVKKNGSKVTIDTQMEKIAVNFSYNAGTQQIILTLIDGTKQYIDLAALITQYEFLESDTVAFSIDSAGKVSAIVKEASIQEKHLRPNYLADIKVEVAKAQASQSAAAKSESNAKASETAAATSESNAATSATKAQSYATGGTNSRTGEDTDNAKYYSQQSAQSQSAAATSADTANTKAEEAAASAATAKTSADNAAGSANLANEKANSAANSATIAVSNSNAAQQYASNAAASADTAQNYAVADTDSAKYYYEQARRISESFSGALRPMGTVAFANLPALSEADGGSMYNISDQFTTTAEFKEGAGNTIPAGANVYKTEDGKWDVLAGTPVTGVKGSAESRYRWGNVNITAENVGAVPVGGNAGSATKLEKSRKISLTGLSEASVNFDGTGDVTLENWGYGMCRQITSGSLDKPYRRIAYISATTNFNDGSMVFVIDSGFKAGGFGIVKVCFRTNVIANANTTECEVFWLARQGFSADQLFVKLYSPAGETQYADLYFKATGTYDAVNITVLAGGGRGSRSRRWEFDTAGVSRENADIRKYSDYIVGVDAGIVNNSKISSSTSYLGRDGNAGVPMTFNWSGKTGQPKWIWGGENGKDMYVYNPSNFSVNYAENSAKVNGHTVNSDVPSDAKFTDTKGRYIGTTVTKPQDKTEMYITYLSSGYIVMAGKTASKSYAMNTQYGNAFWAPFTIYLPPNIVKNIDSVNITPFAETGLISASINGYTSEQITGFVWSPQNETKSISFHVTVHGRA